MKKYFLFGLIIMLYPQLIYASVTIDGHAYLKNKTDHSDIKVIFVREAPSRLVDSTFTDSDGYYSKNIAEGIYYIQYSKSDYSTRLLKSKKLYSNISIQDIDIYSYIFIPLYYPSIQEGIDHCFAGDTVIVDTGIYYENISFKGKDITIGSRFLKTQDTVFISKTIIDANRKGTVVTIGNSKVLLSGLTIQNGFAEYGGGFSIEESSVKIENLFICNNESRYDGGGIRCRYSDLTVNNSTISNNKSGWGDGGGIFCYHSNASVFSVEIKSNSGDYGGGICLDDSNASLAKVDVIKNTARYGGGVECDDSNPLLINTNISNNKAKAEGGGIYSEDIGPTLINSLVIYNTPEGIIARGNLLNCIVANNFGNGIVNCSEIINTIIANNTGFGLKNCKKIEFCNVFNNTMGKFYNCGKYLGEIVTTNINGDSCDAYTNIFKDPSFIDSDNQNYHLRENSPCINAGKIDTVNLSIPNFDFDSNARIAKEPNCRKAIIDLGCYEYNTLLKE